MDDDVKKYWYNIIVIGEKWLKDNVFGFGSGSVQ